MGFKTETNGTGKTRRSGRASYKAKSRVLRRVFDKVECLERAEECDESPCRPGCVECIQMEAGR